MITVLLITKAGSLQTLNRDLGNYIENASVLTGMVAYLLVPFVLRDSNPSSHLIKDRVFQCPCYMFVRT